MVFLCLRGLLETMRLELTYGILCNELMYYEIPSIWVGRLSALLSLTDSYASRI